VHADRLRRGLLYTWTVTALRDGKEIMAPALPTRAEFAILESAKLAKLSNKIRETGSQVVRGITFARAGLLDEAEREFEAYLNAHPTDDRIKQLLQTIRSWRGQTP
jgi:hypothetical protein